jgi:hypothetical protein
MVKANEKKLEKSLGEWVRQNKGLNIKLLPFLFSGLPDRMCLMPNKVIFFVELKSEGKKPTPVQELVHKKIRALGFDVYVIDSIKLLENLKEIYG